MIELRNVVEVTAYSTAGKTMLDLDRLSWRVSKVLLCSVLFDSRFGRFSQILSLAEV